MPVICLTHAPFHLINLTILGWFSNTECLISFWSCPNNKLHQNLTKCNWGQELWSSSMHCCSSESGKSTPHDSRCANNPAWHVQTLPATCLDRDSRNILRGHRTCSRVSHCSQTCRMPTNCSMSPVVIMCGWRATWKQEESYQSIWTEGEQSEGWFMISKMLFKDMVWITLLSILSSKTLEFKYHPPADQHPVSLQQNSKVRLQGLGHCYLSMDLHSFVGPWPLFQVLNLLFVLVLRAQFI
jgi:hypothetical protein